MLKSYPPNRMFSILIILLAMTVYFSFDLYSRDYLSNKNRINFSPSPSRNVSPKYTPNTNPKTTNTEASIPDKKTVSPKSTITMERFYSKCGHTLVTKLDTPVDMVNLSEDDIRIIYKDWNIKTFSSKEIILAKQIDSKCSNHFILKEKDGLVAVYYQEPVNGVSLKEITPLKVQNLPISEQKMLKKGIKVESTNELINSLEDLGS